MVDTASALTMHTARKDTVWADLRLPCTLAERFLKYLLICDGYKTEYGRTVVHKYFSV